MNTPAKPEKPSQTSQLTSDQHAKLDPVADDRTRTELAIAYAVPRLDETPEDLRKRRRRARYHAVMSRAVMRWEQQAFEEAFDDAKPHLDH